MRLPKLNKTLLSRIKRHLSAEPKRYEQSVWGEHVEGEDAPKCNTQGCIAGWAIFLSVKRDRWNFWLKKAEVDGDAIATKARKLLGLTESEGMYLFSPGNQEAKRGPAGVESAKRKIDALIKDRARFAQGVDEY